MKTAMTFTPSVHSYNGPVVTSNPNEDTDEKPMLPVIPLLIGMTVATFVVQPFVIKAFAPEWSYGRRLGASIGLNMAFGVVRSVAKRNEG